MILSWTLPLLLGCALAGAQDEELRRLRTELVNARLENLNLKLRLARLTGRPEEEIKILGEALDSELSEVCAAAFRELGALSEDRRKEVAPFVLGRFAAGRESFRVEAVAFLGRVPLPDAEAAVLRSAADASPAVRKAVAGALKSSSRAQGVDALLALFRDPQRDVRVAALDALGVARRETAVRPLSEALASEKDPLIVEKTIDALGEIGSAAAVGPLLEILARASRGPIAWSCINSLGKIGDARAGPALVPFLDGAQPLDLRHVTLESLGKLKETAALPRISEVLRKDPEEKLRQAAAGAFGLMAGLGAIEETLLPAYLQEPSESVRRAIWTSMLALAGDAFVAHEKLALGFLAAGKTAEADETCTRMHGLKTEGDLRGRRLILEERVADAFTTAGDFKLALPHCRQVMLLAPERSDAARRVAACYRELKDPENALKTLQECRDPEPLIDEIYTRLQSPLPEERVRILETLMRGATLRLIEPLGSPDPATRKSAAEAARREGRKILPALAAELEDGSRLPGPVLEAGTLITGVVNDPSNPGTPKSRATAWRAWLESSKVPR